MSTTRRTARTPLRVERLESRVVPAGLQNFDQTPLATMPAGWLQWSSDGAQAFAVLSGRSFSGARALTSNSTLSSRSALAWSDELLAGDAKITATIYVDSLIPAGVILRGANLGTTSPSYYGVTITRGATIELFRTVGGIRTSLATLKTGAYTSGPWIQLTFEATGNTLRVQAFRTDTQQFLAANGQWTTQAVMAIEKSDSGLTGGGRAGVIRPGAYAGAVTFDDFLVVAATAVDATPPTVSIPTPSSSAAVSGTVQVSADARDDVAVSRVDFFINGQNKATDTAAPYSWDFDTRTLTDGAYTLTVRAFDAAGNVGQSQQSLIVRNSIAPPTTGPVIPQHYDHIRVAMLAWNGTPFTSFENNLIRDSVDLIIPNERYLGQIDQISPNTPQLLYTNLSNVYLDLYTDWLYYADRNGLNRENAFYHVSQQTPFTGGSPSSIPVTYLWSVRRDSFDLTSASRDTRTGDVTFGGVGQSLYLGYPERFRELNFKLASGASSGWSGTFEYASAVDAAGNPIAWKSLPLISNTTNNFLQNGTVQFDPPADWKAARLGGGTPYYYVRIRTLIAGTAPVANQILGRDYVKATYASNGSASGIIPAFDTAADTNRDGYLSDTEYARRAAGKDARFVYESRLFFPSYGQMRLVTNPTGQGFTAWAADYETRFLNANPVADGLHVDNSTGRSPALGVATIESTVNYTADYTAMLVAVQRAIAPHWMIVNTAGYYAESDTVAAQVPADFEEFAIRALSSTSSQFEDLAAQVKRRQALPDPAVFTILDSLPTGGSPTDARTQLATLAYYYLIGDPQSTFLMMYGGYEPATSWTRHWTEAIKYDIGQPLGTWSIFASGADPANSALNYKVYQRTYSDSLVLYKPLSYTRTVGTGTLADNTATTHQLGSAYRPLRADGTLGTPVTSISLRNGEGAILIRA